MVATWDLCLILGGLFDCCSMYSWCIWVGRERRNCHFLAILRLCLRWEVRQARDGSLVLGLKGAACLMPMWLTARFPERGCPHSSCPLGAVPGRRCPRIRAQPLSGNVSWQEPPLCRGAGLQWSSKGRGTPARQHMPWPSFRSWGKRNRINIDVP